MGGNCPICRKGYLKPVYLGAPNRQCDYCWAVFDRDLRLIRRHRGR